VTSPPARIDQSYRGLLRVPQLSRVLASMMLARVANGMVGVAIILFALDEYDSPALAGLVDGQGVYDFVWGPQWAIIDKGGDGWACMKPLPTTPGTPAYFFNGIDNVSSAG